MTLNNVVKNYYILICSKKRIMKRRSGEGVVKGNERVNKDNFSGTY